MRRLVLSFSLLLCIVSVAPASAAPTRPTRGASNRAPAVGQLAPAITGTLVSGSDPVDLERLTGRVIILDFWATWCGPCRMVMPQLDRLHQRHHGRGLTILGISDQPTSVLRAHLQRSPVHYTIAGDGGPTLRRYRVRGIPTLVVIDKGGKVRHISSGVSRGELQRLDRLVSQLLTE